MRAQLLRILDKSYGTDVFSVAGQAESVMPQHTISLLIRCLENKSGNAQRKLVWDESELNEMHRLIELGELLKDERISINIESIVDIYQGNHFRMKYPIDIQDVPCTLKQVIVFHYLSRCKIWPTICKQLNKSREKEYKLRCLIEWYVEFAKRVGITELFEPDALSRKDLRTATKKNLIKSSNSELIETVTNKQYDRVIELLKQGIDVESIQPPNERFQGVMKLRPSHIACDNADLKMCRILDEYKADWQATDSQMMSPIFYAIRSGSMDILKYLVEEKKVNIEKLEIQKRTPFYWACTQGQMEIIKYLRDKGADINRYSEIGRTALSKACFLGRRDIVEFLINCKEINLKCSDKKGRTPLHNAVFGPKGGREAHKFGTCESDSPECAILLLEKGVDANETDNDLNNGLHIALSSQALNSIPVLIAFGGDLTRRNRFRETPIMVGCKFGHTSAVKILVEKYNDSVITKDSMGCNCLVLVAKNLSNGIKLHPLFEYLLPIYMQQAQQNNNALDDIEDTLNRIIGHKANKEILAFQQYLRQNAIKVHISLEVLKKSLEELSDEVSLELLGSEPLMSSQLQSLIAHIIQLRKLHLLEGLVNRFEKQLEEMVLSVSLLEESKQVNDKMLTTAMTLLNVNIIDQRFSDGRNILHFLVENKKIGSLTQVLKIYIGSYGGPIRNKFIHKSQPDQLKEVLRDQLTDCKTQNGMTCIEIALVKKYMDVYKILEAYIHNYIANNSQISSLQHFRIEEYLIIHETDILQLERFKSHEKAQLLSKIIDNYNQIPAEELLERVNRLSKSEEELRHSLTHLDDQQINSFYRNLRESRKVCYCQTENQMTEALACIKDSTVLAIDLEYFIDKTTNQNVICTLQLSCVYRDIVIDCLKLPFRMIRSCIEPFFHDASITKVLHGCEQDLIILKSNFNLSLVNSVDTARIEMALTDKIEMPGLKMVAAKYLHGLDMDKQYQTSEWRLRPLPKAMLQYARCDSLNLLLVYIEILKAMPVNKIKDIFVSNMRVALKNSKPQVPLIRDICPNKGLSDN